VLTLKQTVYISRSVQNADEFDSIRNSPIEQYISIDGKTFYPRREIRTVDADLAKLGKLTCLGI